MRGSEWLVVLGCLVVGYLVVAWLMGDRSGSATPLPGETDERRPPARDGDPGWAVVLGVSPVAGIDDIRAAYRQLMSQYHPDKVASLGQELRELADRKSKQISTAYATAKREREFD